MNLTECQEILEKNSFCRLLQLKVLEVSEGHVKGKLPFTSQVQNMYGSFHGGALYTAADTFCGLAAITCGNPVSTIDANIQYLKAGRDTESIIFDAEVIKNGHTIIVVRFSCRDDKGLLISMGTFSFYVLKNE